MDYMERITNAENGCHNNVEEDTLDGAVVRLSREEVLQALNKIKTVKVPRPSDVPLELIAASVGVKI